MAEHHNITLTDSPEPADMQAVREGLDAYNASQGAPVDWAPLALFLRDAQGAIAGGLTGGTYWGWLYKGYQFILLGALIAFSFILASCSSSAKTPTASLPATIAPLVPTITPTLQPSPSATPLPAATKTPSPKPTKRPTRTPLPPTPTRFPTLEPAAKLDFISRMLKSNGGCELPCWWGIAPGKTRWDEMVDYFIKEGIDVSDDGQLDLGVPDERNYLAPTLDINFQRSGDLVQSVNVRTEYYYLLAQDEFDNVWQAYTLEQVLSSYGVPRQVYLGLSTGAGDWTPGMEAHYDLWLEYDGWAIRYPGRLIRDNHSYQVCPFFGDVGGIELQLESPQANTPLDINVESPFGFSGTLTDLTGLSLQEFHKTFAQFPPQRCMQVAVPTPWWYDEIALPPEARSLSVEQEEALLTSLLTDNGCELPCWWGIRPSETSWKDAEQIFFSHGKSVSTWDDSRTKALGDTGHAVGLFARYSPYPFDYVVEHQVYEKDGMVHLLAITGYASQWSPPQHFAQDWQKYSLHQVLAKYGQPSQVLLHYWDFGWQYSIGLVYEDKGTLVQYVGPIPGGRSFTDTAPVAICPTQNLPTAISLRLAEPGTGFNIADAFAALGYGYPDAHSFYTTSSLEEATEMSIQEFYETFLDRNTQACLSAQRNLGDMAP